MLHLNFVKLKSRYLKILHDHIRRTLNVQILVVIFNLKSENPSNLRKCSRKILLKSLMRTLENMIE